MNLIVFDIDDTLTSSEFQHQLSFVNAMKDFGITQINQHWGTYKHHTDSYILKENYESNLSQKFSFSIMASFENRMLDLLSSLQEVKELNGAKQVIDLFNDHSDYAISFATGSLLKPALLKLDQAQINYNSQLVVGSNELFTREEIVQKAIDKAKSFYGQARFDHIISVGDGLWDLKTAQNLGLHFIGIGPKNYADFAKENIKLHLSSWSGFRVQHMEQKLGLSKP